MPQVVYVQTVVGRADSGGMAVRGLYVGDDIAVFNQAAALSLEVNFEMVPKSFAKCVVYLDPSEFKSTWLRITSYNVCYTKLLRFLPAAASGR